MWLFFIYVLISFWETVGKSGHIRQAVNMDMLKGWNACLAARTAKRIQRPGA